MILPTADNVEKEGYIFAGWYDNENFIGDPIDKINSTDTGDKNIVCKMGSGNIQCYDSPKELLYRVKTKSVHTL